MVRRALRLVIRLVPAWRPLRAIALMLRRESTDAHSRKAEERSSEMRLFLKVAASSNIIDF